MPVPGHPTGLDSGECDEGNGYSATASKLSLVRGTVRTFNKQGRYGSIEVEESADTDEDEGEDVDDVFFHMADIGGPNLPEGQTVEFEIEQSDKGPRASNLTRLDDDGNPMEPESEQESRADDGVIVDEDGTRWVSINDL